MENNDVYIISNGVEYNVPGKCGMTASELSNELNIPIDKVNMVLQKLKENGMITSS